jgi:NodT family efflux transporter outer membrane factor (OMF) lipoprotein
MLRPLGARLGRAPTLSLLLLSSACATVPDLGPEPQARAPQDYQSTLLASPGAAWPAQGWWLRYGDDQLSRLMSEALADSPDLAAAAARMRAAEGYAQAAGAALKPSLDAFASTEIAKQSSNGALPEPLTPQGWQDSGTAGLSLSLNLDLWGKNRAALRAATSDRDAARFEYQEAKLALTTAIASTYAELARLHAQHDSLASAVEIRAQTAALVSKRVANGLDTRAELKQAEARLAQARAELTASDEAIALTGNAIAALVGTGPDRALSISRPDVEALEAQGLPVDASIDLAGRRPDIAAARARVEAASARTREARAAFYPDINISALVGLQAVGLGNLISGNSSFASASPAISLPLFHGGALSGQYRGRRGQYDEAVANYDARVIAAFREIADAVTSQSMLDRRLADSRRALTDFEEAYGLARRRYENGLATYLDVLAAEEGVLAARLAVAELETRAFTLDVALIRALGGGFEAA